jgi:hypothetical protein
MIWTSTDERHAGRRFSSLDHFLNLWPKPTRVVSRQVADALSIDLHHHGFRVMGIVGLQHEESRAVVAVLPAGRRSADLHKCLLVVGLADNGELSRA